MRSNRTWVDWMRTFQLDVMNSLRGMAFSPFVAISVEESFDTKRCKCGGLWFCVLSVLKEGMSVMRLGGFAGARHTPHAMVISVSLLVRLSVGRCINVVSDAPHEGCLPY